MNNSPSSIFLKAIGTLLLAAGFLFFVTRAPFTPQDFDSASTDPFSATTTKPDTALPTPAPLPGDAFLKSPTSSVAVTAGLSPSLGLFNASFAGSDSGSGFSTSEELVPGPCADAGVRYFQSVCPDCVDIGHSSTDDSRSMLVWTESADGKYLTRTVSRDCVGSSPAGSAIVGTLTFGNEPVDLTLESKDMALDRLPLIAGATRVGVVEMGAWLTAFDDVARPSTALDEMASRLETKGWRETSTKEIMGSSFEGERVFTNSADAFCVISLSKQGDGYRLVTVVSSQS